MAKRVLIIGGVAGGMSAAARLRRLDETAEIIVLERGGHVSFANCGLPYHIGGEIADRDDLLLMTPDLLKARAALDVRVRHEAVAIDRGLHEVMVRNLATGTEYRERYDALVLAPGAAPLRPPLPGIDHPAIRTLRNIDDMDGINALLAGGARRALIMGGGYIGLEMAEALRRRNLDVVMVEITPQVMGPIDPEMATLLHRELRLNQVDLRLGVSVTGFHPAASGAGVTVALSTGDRVEADLVLLAAGVKPETSLAKAAGLALGERGGIRVDAQMRTSDPSIWAVGDAIEVVDTISGTQVLVPLAGPANRQGRIAADVIAGRDSRYTTTQGTGICKLFNLTVGITGLSTKTARRLGISCRTVFLHPVDHAGYYPGAARMVLKVLFDPADGRVLGAQAVGTAGIDKRLDVLALAVRHRLTVRDLEAEELAYAPPYGAARDAINYVGFIAGDLLAGDVDIADPDTVDVAAPGQGIVDVSTPSEYRADHLEGAINLPIDDLRQRLGELDRGKTWLVHCASGQRSYLACRILAQNGLRCRNLNGGLKTWRLFFPKDPSMPTARKTPAAPPVAPAGPLIEVDACGCQCPGPILKLRQAIDAAPDGGRIRIIASEPGFAADVPAWCATTGQVLESLEAKAGRYIAIIRKSAATAHCSAAGVAVPEGMTAVVFSGDFDKAMAAFIIANGAAAMGLKPTLFFTFWGLNVLRRDARVAVRKTFIEKMFGFMMPRGSRKLALSKMHMAGMGLAMIKGIMRKKQVASLEELIASAQQAGVRLVACAMSMDLMGIKPEELIDGVEIGGVAAYLQRATGSAVNLFI
jgi:NADPH-dependent 2,4-dienoyl-CoA reductase/sulfur reductase-like enzyme/peroxiredoxin family protein/rhodanese-related sulfurtransferase/TusA-related sulfurtransferase